MGEPTFRILGGGKGGPNSQQAHDVELTSMRRNDVASTPFRRHVPTRVLINQCQIITCLILKSDNIENSRTELKGILLPVPSNQIKVTFIIILPFNLVLLSFFPVSHRNYRKMWVDYWVGGEGGQKVAPSSYAYVERYFYRAVTQK